MYQAVFFDAGETLFYVSLKREERIARALARRERSVEMQILREADRQVDAEMQSSPLWPLCTKEREDQ